MNRCYSDPIDGHGTHPRDTGRAKESAVGQIGPMEEALDRRIDRNAGDARPTP